MNSRHTRVDPGSSAGRRFSPVVLALWLLTTHAPAAEITVFAAASLADSLREISKTHEAKTGDRVRLNLHASNLLARQIVAGAPADLFFSADEASMDQLERQGQLAAGTRRSPLSNQLVVVSPTDRDLQVRQARDLAQPAVRHLALPDPRTVPAGSYARGWLERTDVWKSIEPRIVPTDNVRAALAAVAAGNADLGIVYKTDAPMSKQVRVVFEVPVADAPAIRYSVAALRSARDLAAARRFLAALESRASRDVFRKFGFIVLE